MKIKLKNKLDIFYYDEVELSEGLTIIAGCNGSGKSTLSKEIKDFCDANHITNIYLDCSYEFHHESIDNFNKAYSFESIIGKGFSSEHEYYEKMFSDRVKTFRPGDEFKGKDFVIIIDGLDSGGDVIFYNNHLSLFKLIVEDAKSRGINMYLIVTCNNFYYLSKSQVGEMILCPMLHKDKLPVYNANEFDKYVEDIRDSAISRGFRIE